MRLTVGLSFKAIIIFKNPEIFTALVVAGSFIERGTDPKAA